MTERKDLHLLIVDDEKHILEILSLLLSKHFTKITTAMNGKEGLEKITQHSDIKCVLSDIRMPIMDGISFIKEVRAKGNDVPFIFFTGHGTDPLMIEATKYGAFDFISKPNFKSLEQVILNATKESGEADDLVKSFENIKK